MGGAGSQCSGSVGVGGVTGGCVDLCGGGLRGVGLATYQFAVCKAKLAGIS